MWISSHVRLKDTCSASNLETNVPALQSHEYFEKATKHESVQLSCAISRNKT